jgi:S1-C subfamily serine protease
MAASGLVIELGRSLVAGNPGHANEELTDLIVFAASIESGDSGGPLIDTAGDVIGLVTAGEPTAAGMVGYAIPINTAIAIANQLAR